MESAEGGSGNDTLVGDSGANTLEGGAGDDTLEGGAGADVSVGGEGDDTFVAADGGDTYDSRDGTEESVTCVSGDTVVNDLVDVTQQQNQCATVTTAAAKHEFDTRLLLRRLVIRPNGSLAVRVRCPARKTEDCAGRLSVLRGARSKARLASRRYRVGRGHTRRVVLRLDARDRLLLGRRATLRASEIDDDRRRRFVLAHARVRRP